MIAILHVDLTETTESWAQQGHWDRKVLDAVTKAPDSAVVVVNVGNRQHVTEDAARWLHEADQRLTLHIVSTDIASLRRFHAAITAGTTRDVA